MFTNVEVNDNIIFPTPILFQDVDLQSDTISIFAVNLTTIYIYTSDMSVQYKLPSSSKYI